MKKILVIDDDVAVTNYLMVFLMQTSVFDPVVINDSRQVMDRLASETFDIVLLDMDMPNVSGMDILGGMREKGMVTPVVVLTGVSDIDLAVRAMKLGAFDYLFKPVEDEKLLEVLDNAMEHGILHKSIDELPQQLAHSDLAYADAFAYVQTQDPGMIRLFHQAEKLASSDLGVFIWGESGTGKEALARAIHQASPRRDNPFLALEADSQDPERFPAFFFGQARVYGGSKEETKGILEEANHGTLFLNSIDALTLPMQVRLKRVIQRGEYYRESSAQVRKVDVRIIVSSTNDLTRPEFEDTFIRDLLYHLMINSLRIPPLRERPGDIPLLAEHLLREECERIDKPVKSFSPECMELLKRYSFPNNVQELLTLVASAVASTEGETIGPEALPEHIRKGIEVEKIAAAEAFTPRALDRVVAEHVDRTLEYFDGDRERAAEKLGISRDELDRIVGGDGCGSGADDSRSGSTPESR
jgi:DNA-binding NtrC family response regulator